MTRRTSVNRVALLLALTGTFNLQGAENAAQAVASSHPQLRYHPEGEAIVCPNGGSDFNRPLYCNQSWPTILSATARDGLGWIGTAFSVIWISPCNVATMWCGCMISRASHPVTRRAGCSGFSRTNALPDCKSPWAPRHWPAGWAMPYWS